MDIREEPSLPDIPIHQEINNGFNSVVITILILLVCMGLLGIYSLVHGIWYCCIKPCKKHYESIRNHEQVSETEV